MKYLSILCASIITFQSVTAEPRLSDEPTRGRRGELLRELDLSDAQRTKLKEIRAKYGSSRDSMRGIGESRQKLIELLSDPKSSDEDIRAHVKRMSEDFSSLSKNRAEKMLEMRRVLTKQQFSTLLESMKDLRQRFQRNHQDSGEDGSHQDRTEMQHRPFLKKRWAARREQRNNTSEDFEDEGPRDEEEFSERRRPPPPPHGGNGARGNQAEEDLGLEPF